MKSSVLFLNKSPLQSLSSLHSINRISQLNSLQNANLVGVNVLKGKSIMFNLLSAFAICVSYADRSNMSTAIIPMTTFYNWSSSFSGLVLSSFYVGYAITQIIGGKLADKYGGENILVAALLLWSVCTGLTPYAASLGSTQLITLRILLGAGEGLAFPAIHSMIPKYIDKSQRSSSTAIITAACYLGALLSNLVSPYLIELGGFQSCFELFALIPPLIWLPLWLNFMRSSRSSSNSNKNSVKNSQDSNSNNSSSSNNLIIDSVEVIPKVSSTVVSKSVNKQKVVLTTTLDSDTLSKPGQTSSSNTALVPMGDEKLTVKELLSYKSVWAIAIAQFGQSCGMIGLLSWLPTYYYERFHVPINELSSFTVLPYFLQMMVAVGSGVFADRLINGGIRKLFVRLAFQLSGMLLPAAALAYITYVPSLSTVAASNLINIGTAFSALTVAAVSTSQFDISPANSGTIFGIGNTFSCIAGFLTVPLTGWIYQTTGSFDLVFGVFIANYLIGAFFWSIWASDTPLARKKRSEKMS